MQTMECNNGGCMLDCIMLCCNCTLYAVIQVASDVNSQCFELKFKSIYSLPE